MGNSRHCAPVQRIHSTPFSTARVSAGGRPRPSARRGNRTSGSSRAQSASDTSPHARIHVLAGSPAPTPLCRYWPQISRHKRLQPFIRQVLMSGCLGLIARALDTVEVGFAFCSFRAGSFAFASARKHSAWHETSWGRTVGHAPTRATRGQLRFRQVPNKDITLLFAPRKSIRFR